MRWFKGRQVEEPVAPLDLTQLTDTPLQFLAQEVGWQPGMTKLRGVKDTTIRDEEGVVLEISASAIGTADFTTFQFFFPQRFVMSLGEIVGQAVAHTWMKGRDV